LISGWISKHKHHSAIANKNPSLKTQTQISKDIDKKERALNKKNKENKEIKSEREREKEREPRRVAMMCAICVAL